MLTKISERPIEAGEGSRKQSGKETTYVFERAQAAYTQGRGDDASRMLGSQGLQKVASLARNAAGAMPLLSKGFHEIRVNRGRASHLVFLGLVS